MTREEAINHIKYGVIENNYPLPKELGIEVFDMAIKALEQEPSSSENPNRWIPVSERLPEKNGKYLAYIINKKDTNLQYIMTCEYYEGDLWNWFPDDDCASDNVVAWMPLPESYKAESKDKVCRGCHYDDGKPHAECVLCDKAESEG